MKRYRLFRGKLREHPEGEWVKYQEAQAVELAAAEAEGNGIIERLQAETFPATWAGLLAYLDSRYPNDVFERSTDPGAQIARLAAEVAKLKGELQAAYQTIKVAAALAKRVEEAEK